MDRFLLEGKRVYGGTLTARLSYVTSKYGPDGLKKLYKKMLSGGFEGPAKPDDIQIKEAYPMANMIILLECFRETYGEKEMREMSRAAPRKGGIVGWFVRWATSPEVLMRKASEYWPNFYTFGKLEGRVTGDGHGELHGQDICVDPIMCDALTWYFRGVMENAVRNVTCEHVSCACRGDPVGKWEIAWKSKK